MYLTVFVVDLVCAVAEITGGNAKLLKETSLVRSIEEYPSTVLTVLAGVNKTYLFIGTIIIVLALDVSVSKNAEKKGAEQFRKMLFLFWGALVIDFIYVSIVSIRVGGYLSRSVVYNGILLWVVVSVSISFACILKIIEELRAFIPLIVFVMFFVMIIVPNNVGNGFGLGDRMYGSREENQFYYDEVSVWQSSL